MTIYDDLDHAEEVVSDAISAAKEEIRRLRGERNRLRVALADARKSLIDASENMEDWGTYVSEYFREKHDLQADLTAITEAVQAIDKTLEEQP